MRPVTLFTRSPHIIWRGSLLEYHRAMTVFKITYSLRVNFLFRFGVSFGAFIMIVVLLLLSSSLLLLLFFFSSSCSWRCCSGCWMNIESIRLHMKRWTVSVHSVVIVTKFVFRAHTADVGAGAGMSASCMCLSVCIFESRDSYDFNILWSKCVVYRCWFFFLFLFALPNSKCLKTHTLQGIAIDHRAYLRWQHLF